MTRRTLETLWPAGLDARRVGWLGLCLSLRWAAPGGSLRSNGPRLGACGHVAAHHPLLHAWGALTCVPSVLPAAQRTAGCNARQCGRRRRRLLLPCPQPASASHTHGRAPHHLLPHPTPSHHPQSPLYVFSPNKVYTFCVWARLGPNSPNVSNTRIDLVYTSNNWPMASAPISITGVWKQHCLSNFQPGTEFQGEITILMGFVAGTYYWDDASLIAVDAVGTPTSYQTQPFVLPLVPVEAVHIPYSNKFLLHNQPGITGNPFSAAVLDMDGYHPVSSGRGSGRVTVVLAIMMTGDDDAVKGSGWRVCVRARQERAARFPAGENMYTKHTYTIIKAAGFWCRGAGRVVSRLLAPDR